MATITKAAYLNHKAGRRDFPTFEQYVANSEAAGKRSDEFDAIVAGVTVEYGKTIGQILWANRGTDRRAIEKAVCGSYEVIGYRAGYAVYGNKK